MMLFDEKAPPPATVKPDSPETATVAAALTAVMSLSCLASSLMSPVPVVRTSVELLMWASTWASMSLLATVMPIVTDTFFARAIAPPMAYESISAFSCCASRMMSPLACTLALAM